MAFGINRKELEAWKKRVSEGKIAYLTHFWTDPRFPGIHTVTKVGCADLERLTAWCVQNGLNPKYIHQRVEFPHFDLIGEKQKEILQKEELWEQLTRFRIV
ncbi:hypothetical protein [Brevibacillus migulae]|uniref:hypothetical protein n=1 Tax=Brevibacillus migulae TaxID=1644114 RepID=UPI00106E2C92|nr:hypothetical protein [Brevibacillus migulae]